MTEPYTPADLKHALDYMIRTVRQGGGVARADFRRPGLSSLEKPGEGIVTLTDKVIEDLVRTALSYRDRPDEGIVAEEARRATNWVIDALDGSRNFAEGVPLFAVMTALVDQLGQPLLGIIHNPVFDDMLTAIRGQGTHLNNQPVRVNDNRQIAGSRIVVPSEKWEGLDVGGLVACLINMGAEIITSGSYGYDGMRMVGINGGNVTGLIYPYGSPWDMAALKIALEEAMQPDGTGGVMTSLTGEQQDYSRELNGAVGSNGYIQDELLEVVSRFLH